MTNLKQAFSLGFTGALATFIASYFTLSPWVLFIAWGSYHLFGTHLKTAFTILIQQFFGILIIRKATYTDTPSLVVLMTESGSSITKNQIRRNYKFF